MKIKTMSKLIKLTPDPISFSVVEIRFSPKIPLDVFFGMIYMNIKDQYPKIQKHKENKTNKLHPKYALLDESFAINIGSNIISFASIRGYLGWKEIFSRIEDFFRKIDSLDIFDKISRIGLRYINFFEDITDISEHLKLDLSYNFDTPPPITNQITSSFIVENGILCTINIENNAENNNKQGSIVDIDCSFNTPISYDFKKILGYIDKCHIVEKDYFVKIIKQDLLNKYNAQYK